MKMVLKQFLFVCLSTVLLRQITTCQSLPIPEYFGVYAVVDGKLLKLDANEVRSDKNVSVRIGHRNGVGNVVNRQPAALPSTNIQVPIFSPNLKIIIFAESSGTQSPLATAKSLHL